MRVPRLAFPLLLILAIGKPADAQQGTAVSEARAVADKAMASFNARDYAAYEALLADDIEAFTGVYTPLRFVGKAQWLAFIRGLDNYAAASYEPRQPMCRAYNNDVVLCNAYFVFSTTTRDGVTQIQSGRESTTIVRIGGRWLVANYHFSPLF